MSDFFKTVERLANLKGLATLFLLLVVLVFVWRNLDFFSEVTFKIDRNKIGQEPSAMASSGQPPNGASPTSYSGDNGVFSPIVTRLEISPVAFSLPSYFLIGIKNDGLDPGYLDVSLDFGSALIRAYEARPRDAFVLVSGDTATSALKGRFTRVDPEETVYIYTLLSQPALQQAIVRGSGNAVVKTAADARGASLVKGFISPAMVSWFRFVVSVAVTVLFIIVCALPFAWASSRADKSGDPPQAPSPAA